jgi:hypothetical protein
MKKTYLYFNLGLMSAKIPIGHGLYVNNAKSYWYISKYNCFMRTILQRRFLQCRVQQLDKQSAILQYKKKLHSQKNIFLKILFNLVQIFSDKLKDWPHFSQLYSSEHLTEFADKNSNLKYILYIYIFIHTTHELQSYCVSIFKFNIVAR